MATDPELTADYVPNYQGNAHLSVDVLDHGFVALRNIAGPTRRAVDTGADSGLALRPYDADDTDPANSARMSFDASDDPSRTRESDFRLARYLMENWHTTPFEMVEIWLDMKMPIFVARQFVRHRTVSINEISARYVQLPSEWYIPETVGGKAPNAKQGQDDNLPLQTQEYWKAQLERFCAASYREYSQALLEGVAPEHARMFLHLNHYTRWLWKQDLHNMMHFLSLRMDSHAQVEAQAYARGVYALLRMVLPNSMALFDEYRRK